jgi:hypothetical protein
MAFRLQDSRVMDWNHRPLDGEDSEQPAPQPSAVAYFASASEAEAHAQQLRQAEHAGVWTQDVSHFDWKQVWSRAPRVAVTTLTPSADWCLL